MQSFSQSSALPLQLTSQRKSEKYSIDSTAFEILKQYSHNRVFSSGGDSALSSKSSKTEIPPQVNHNLFRYEGDGVVVYDSTARMPGDTSVSPWTPEARDPSTYEKRDLELAGEADRQQFLSLPKYPPFKPRTFGYTLLIPDNCLRFDSHFESGNLRKAIKVTDYDYRLLLEFDVHTQAHTQWYYFSVGNTKAQMTVTFAIENLIKYDSLYLNGMQPLVYSKAREAADGTKWHRSCSNISYYQNKAPRTGKVPSFYYTLSFQYTFQHTDDTVYFAHCYPYTHTDLLRDLTAYQSDPRNTDVLRVDSLCMTLAGNNCPVLTITSDVQLYPSWESEYVKMMKSAAGRRILRQRERRTELPEHCKKRAVILTARVHPGESNSSYMLKGAIDFLLSNTREARILRREYVFKIVPMLNPDGVKYGNYRCSLLGVDLNRRWIAPNRILHPTVYYTKRLVQMISEEHELVMYCDMHGHSMKKNVFVYGCTDKIDPKRNALLKLIPLLLQQRNKIFSFQDSHFRLEKCKEATARVVVFRELNVLNSYTLEASFCGPEHSAALENRTPEEGEVSGPAQMTQSHLGTLGRDLCKTLMVFLSPQLFRRKLNELTALLAQQLVPPSFAKDPPAVSVPEEKTAQSDSKALEDLEKPNSTFTIDNAIEEIGQQETLMEELSLVKELDDQSSDGSNASVSESEDLQQGKEMLPPLNTPRSVQAVPKVTTPSPVKAALIPAPKSTPRSLPPKRPQPKAHYKSIDSSDRLQSLTVDSSTTEDARTVGLNKEVERIYKMLKFYQEAGGRLKAGQVAAKGRPFSPVKLNQSVFPDVAAFDKWTQRKGEQKPSEIAPASVSPERMKRREKRAVNVKSSRDEPEERDLSRLSVTVRDAPLPTIRKSVNLHRY